MKQLLGRLTNPSVNPIDSRQPCTSAQSRLEMALTVRRPRPGQLKMVFVTMAPARSTPNCRPMTVTMGTGE